jgi:hypothetical protein
MYDVELELVRLVKNISAFYGPITEASGLLVANQKVLDRMAYNQVRQDLPNLDKNFIPYLYWTGPLNYDKGQTSVGSSGTKKADFWFWCCHRTLTSCMLWVNDIEIAVERMSFPYPMGSVRLTAAILIDKCPLLDDQVRITAQEFPVSRAMIGFTFGYQSTSS